MTKPTYHWILVHPEWGYLSLPDYPGMWSTNRVDAHHFRTREDAHNTRCRWNEAVEITILKSINMPHPLPDQSFEHAARGVVHAMMASLAMAVHADLIDEDDHPFIERAVTMLNFWASVDKHFRDISYVWLPSSGVLPEGEPQIGEDCYQPLDQSKRRKGGIKGRLARLMREHDGHKLH